MNEMIFQHVLQRYVKNLFTCNTAIHSAIKSWGVESGNEATGMV